MLSGEFTPGQRLDEATLAERFGVSRTPVREALRQLSSTGLIESRPRRGAIVATATSAQLEALFGAMAEIEAVCARLAAMSMTPIERRRLQNLHESMAALARRGDRDDYVAANVAFHIGVYLRRAQRDPRRLRQEPAAPAGAVPPRPVPRRGAAGAFARRAWHRRQGDPRLRRRRRSRRDVPPHEPGRGFVRPARPDVAGERLSQLSGFEPSLRYGRACPGHPRRGLGKHCDRL